MELELTTDRYPPITRQTGHPLLHSAPHFFSIGLKHKHNRQSHVPKTKEKVNYNKSKVSDNYGSEEFN